MSCSFNVLTFAFNDREEILYNIQNSSDFNIAAHISLINNCDFPNTIYSRDLCSNNLTDDFYDYIMPFEDYKTFYYQYLPVFASNRVRQSLGEGEENFPETVYAFRNFALYFYNLFLAKDIKFLLLGTFPHEQIDLIMYALAKHLGIKVLCLKHIPYLEDQYFFAYEDIEDIGKITKQAVLPCKKTFSIGSYVTLGDDFIKQRQTAHGNLRFYEEICPVSLFIHRLLKLRYFYKLSNLISCPSLDLSQNFIYFPLHFQPEAATSIYSDILFDDQVLALELLSEKLPPNTTIVIKENPAQGPFYRPMVFYKRLLNIPNIVIAPPNIHSHSLIQAARCVATVSGTAGFEALAFNKPVICFGRPFYRDFPGCFQYSSSLDVEKVLSHVVSHTEVDLAFNSLMATSLHGSIDSSLTACDNTERNGAVVGHQLIAKMNELVSSDPDYLNVISSRLDAARAHALRNKANLSSQGLPNFSPCRDKLKAHLEQSSLLRFCVVRPIGPYSINFFKHRLRTFIKSLLCRVGCFEYVQNVRNRFKKPK